MPVEQIIPFNWLEFTSNIINQDFQISISVKQTGIIVK